MTAGSWPRELKLESDTLIFILEHNGGLLAVNGTRNDPRVFRTAADAAGVRAKLDGVNLFPGAAKD